ncbi:MAG: DNA mismatch repair endonuclease MutL [Ruminococcaceae bacterium]|nr:DNA mismatch repair endonuclease MutL [Oscillospiraceae bacterium]
MPNIQVLDPHVADLIAAGEVVERPASVAKELMENAIDAGAKKVTVEIANGGMSLIRVTDDGCGMEPDQLATAFLRHATSKLRTEYDLEAIGTLGFRGEALAAICAVARIDVMTRTPGAEFGASLSLEGGVAGAVEEAGCPEGTTMVVRDLFFNTPARLKFMKKDAAEGAAVFAVVQRLALAHPEVSVKFIRDGRQELLTPGDGKLQSAIYAVLGRDLALGFKEVQGSGEDMSVSGFATLPVCCKGSRNYQHFFVNGRYVKSKVMTAALEEAYANQRMVGKFPGCVLHLQTKLSMVDVNVHPTKTEVKFTNERQVFSAVYHAVLSALTGERSHPAAVLEKPKAHDTVTPNQIKFNATPIPPAKPAGTALPLHDFTAPKSAPVQTATPEKTVVPTRAPKLVDVLWEPAPKAETIPQSKPEPEASEVKCGEAATQTEAQRSGFGLERRSKEAMQSFCPQAETAHSELCDDEEPWKIAGELFRTYILVEQGETVLLIDKHAAHERMNFDRMKAEGYAPMMQTLLTPVTFAPEAEERSVLADNLSLLAEFGFEVEEFGTKDLIVRQAPFDVDEGDIVSTLTEIAVRLLSTGRADPSAARDEVLHTMACKAAIKGGWKSSPQELERVARAVMDGEVKYCPHGRPVAIELTKKDLEKQFKRA